MPNLILATCCYRCWSHCHAGSAREPQWDMAFLLLPAAHSYRGGSGYLATGLVCGDEEVPVFLLYSELH